MVYVKKRMCYEEFPQVHPIDLVIFHVAQSGKYWNLNKLLAVEYITLAAKSISIHHEEIPMVLK